MTIGLAIFIGIVILLIEKHRLRRLTFWLAGIVVAGAFLIGAVLTVQDHYQIKAQKRHDAAEANAQSQKCIREHGKMATQSLVDGTFTCIDLSVKFDPTPAEAVPCEPLPSGGYIPKGFTLESPDGHPCLPNKPEPRP